VKGRALREALGKRGSAPKTNDLIREEWDFSKCPGEQLALCREYEFQRENEAFKKQVREYRAEFGPWNFEEGLQRFRHPGNFEWPDDEEHSEIMFDLMYGSHGWYPADFPTQPFLGISLGRRKLIIAALSYTRPLETVPLRDVIRLARGYPDEALQHFQRRQPKETSVAADKHAPLHFSRSAWSFTTGTRSRIVATEDAQSLK